MGDHFCKLFAIGLQDILSDVTVVLEMRLSIGNKHLETGENGNFSEHV